jgi:hypothetical protein
MVGVRRSIGVLGLAVVLVSGVPGGALGASPVGGGRSSWSIVTTPNAASVANQLNSVACASSSDCWAVGYSEGTSPLAQNLAEHWDGGAWSIVSVPVTGPNAFNSLQGVTCVNGEDCWAVGFSTNPGTRTLAEHWDGHAWTIVTTVDPGAFQGLSSVTCTGANDCWAVGSGTDRTLAEHWDGRSWSLVPTPNTAANNNALNGVACVAATSCWAVGQSGIGDTFAEHWDGHAWSIVATPNASPATNNLVGIACSNEADCWAVGEANVGFSPQDRTLAEHWNGQSWSIVTTPNLDPDEDNTLWAVTCPRSRLCWAVGWSSNKNALATSGHTEIMRWNGRVWSLVAAPNPSASENSQLRGVACVAPDSQGRSRPADADRTVDRSTACWTVGVALAATPIQTPSQTLAQVLDAADRADIRGERERPGV